MDTQTHTDLNQRRNWGRRPTKFSARTEIEKNQKRNKKNYKRNRTELKQNQSKTETEPEEK